MPICDPARDGSSSSSSGSSCKRQSRDPTTGRGDSCTNMNINTTPRRQATPTTSLGSDRTGEGLPRLDKRERAVSRRALEEQRQQRAEQQQQLLQRATVPRSVKDRGDPRTNMSAMVAVFEVSAMNAMRTMGMRRTRRRAQRVNPLQREESHPSLSREGEALQSLVLYHSWFWSGTHKTSSITTYGSGC